MYFGYLQDKHRIKIINTFADILALHIYNRTKMEYLILGRFITPLLSVALLIAIKIYFPKNYYIYKK